MCEGSAGNVRQLLVYKNVLITNADGDTNVRVWALEDGTPYAVLKGHTDAVNAIALFGQGTVLSGGEDECIRQWNLLGKTRALPQDVFTEFSFFQIVSQLECGVVFLKLL